MDRGRMIGQGRTADVYEWDQNQVLKLFKERIPEHLIENEFNTSIEINRLGLPSPKVIAKILYEGRDGIIYEKVQGVSMLKNILSKPWLIAKEAKRLAELHFKVHQSCSNELPALKLRLENNIKHTNLISAEKKNIIIGYLNNLPDGQCVCHGDFHPDNIFILPERVIILDWMTATKGSPEADVARTTLLLRVSSLPEQIPTFLRVIVNILRSKLYKEYIKAYLELSHFAPEEIDKWELPVAAARLIEWILNMPGQNDHVDRLNCAC